MTSESDKLIAKIKLVKASNELIVAKVGGPQNLSKDQVNLMERNMIEALIPEALKDVSADTLRKMILEKHIQDTSLYLVRASERGERSFNDIIEERHMDLLDDLVKHWLDKGFKVEVVSHDSTTPHGIVNLSDAEVQVVIAPHHKVTLSW